MQTKVESCRLCGDTRLESILNLGAQSFTGMFPKSRTELVPVGTLELIKCANCDLVQLGHSFDLNLLYGQNYGYRSGLNQSMVAHLRRKVERILANYEPEAGSLVIDIGSNDSTLLQGYPQDRYTLIGIDPTGKKFGSYYPKNIQLIPDFFSAERIRKQVGNRQAKVITSLAMFYDLEDPQSFAEEIAQLLAADGIWVFEQSYLPRMLEQTSYDTICHEHLEYYALKQIKWITDRAGLKIVDVEFNDVNGGSFSVTATPQKSPHPENTALIQSILDKEEALGLSTRRPYDEFAERVREHRRELVELVDSLKRQGKTVFGYGASSKGNVLLQYCNFSAEDIPFIAEVNEDKFGAFTPGSGIPIVSEEQARTMHPDFFLVLPWHFKKGLMEREKPYLVEGGRMIFPLPSVEIVSDK